MDRTRLTIVVAVVIVIILLALLAVVLPAFAQRENAVTARGWQWGTNRNASQSGSNSVIEATITGINGQRIFLYSVSARCTTGPPTVTIRDGNAYFTYVVGSPSVVNFRPAWTAAGAATVYVGMSQCAGSGEVDVQADQF